MLTVRFFARVREELGCSELQLPWETAVSDLNRLQDYLCTAKGARWREVLGQSNMIRAVNQTVANDNQSLQDGDEVAFFPPVTGG